MVNEYDMQKRILELETALWRIRERAQRFLSGEIQVTAWSLADYDVHVVNEVLGPLQPKDGADSSGG